MHPHQPIAQRQRLLDHVANTDAAGFFDLLTGPRPVSYTHLDVYKRQTYDQILTTGEAANPRAPPAGKRGRTQQSQALNLIDRLRRSADDLWRFMTAPGVPFTNNRGEQVIRMPKVKQKVAGGFRTPAALRPSCLLYTSRCV